MAQHYLRAGGSKNRSLKTDNNDKQSNNIKGCMHKAENSRMSGFAQHKNQGNYSEK